MPGPAISAGRSPDDSSTQPETLPPAPPSEPPALPPTAPPAPPVPLVPALPPAPPLPALGPSVFPPQLASSVESAVSTRQVVRMQRVYTVTGQAACSAPARGSGPNTSCWARRGA
ncbi:MAG: hypothetical protein DYH12_31000 [Sorangiineae bacterium PRO1]|nr:hypothetical protein [Sorangiineae bacterium PRO1]